MEQRLIQKFAQKLLFSPKMQESMYILQMPIMELKSLIESEMQSNPLLEEQSVESLPIKSILPARENDIRRDLRITKPITLHDVLMNQLRMLATSQDDIEIGKEIIGNIDDDGYLKASLEEISASVGVDILTVEAMAAIVQTFEPLGICARDLKECLLIQLQAKGKKDSLAWKIVENYLNECGRKQYLKITKGLKASIDEVKMAISEISKLEPKPGRKYSNKAETQYIIPDFYVKKVSGEFQVISNQSDIPNVRISSLYRDMLESKNSDKETQNYIRDKLKAANFLIKCIRQRWETMQRIIEFLIKEQGESMEKGRSFLKPLTFKHIAKAIGRHESTVSRAIANKYIDTPSGIFELREFFNGKVANHVDPEADHSTVSVKMQLKALIDKEDKSKPLSDQKLQIILSDKGIKISRRTIAKYRDELKILPTHLRKS